MIEKTPIFTIDLYTQEDFLNQQEIDNLILGIKKEDLLDYSFFKGDAKSSYVAMQEQKPNILDFHTDIADKIINKVLETLPDLNEWLNPKILNKFNNQSWKNSILKLHDPQNIGNYKGDFFKRLVFDEILASFLIFSTPVKLS